MTDRKLLRSSFLVSTAAIASLAAIFCPSGHAKTVRDALPPLLQRIEKEYSSSSTFAANFEQKVTSAATRQTRKSEGRILIQRPQKIRWETLRPDPNLLLSDGQKVIYYTPPFDEGERGQLIERPSAGSQSRLAQALLSGRFSLAREMRILPKSPTVFRMVPKPGTAGTVIVAELLIDPQGMRITKVTLENKGGNKTEIFLKDIELGKPIPEGEFQFTPPPGTDRVNGDPDQE